LLPCAYRIECSSILPLFVNMQLKVCVYDDFFFLSRVSCYQFSVHLFRCVGLVLFFIKNINFSYNFELFREIFSSSSSLNFFSFLEFSWKSIFPSRFFPSLFLSLSSAGIFVFLTSSSAVGELRGSRHLSLVLPFSFFGCSLSFYYICFNRIAELIERERERRGRNRFVSFAFVACIVTDQLLYTIAFGCVPWCLLSCSFCTLIALLILSFLIFSLFFEFEF